LNIPTVLLFDIDGTLVSTGGAGRKALELAFGELHQRDDAIATFKLGGMTDRAIVRQGLELIGQPPTDAAIALVIAKYLEFLALEVPKVEEEKYVVHPGMREAIAAGKKMGAAIGLGTGNMKNGAKIKLSRVGLYEQFQFGGFGDDHELRPELIRRGAQRGVRLLRVNWSDARIVVIGDTPHDIAAAHAIEAQCMAVGTGGFTLEQLKEAGADWAFENLASPGAIEVMLDG
jgi:phosphoglycolate phosphatase